MHNLIRSVASIENPLLEMQSPGMSTFLNKQNFLKTLSLGLVKPSSSEAILEFCQNGDRARPLKSRSELLKRLGNNRDLYILQSNGNELVTALPLATLFLALSDAEEIPRNIESIINEEGKPEIKEPTLALFYSVSSPWREVAGMGLGRKLIYEAKEDLQKRFPSLKRFCTMSPALSFGPFLKERGFQKEFDIIQEIKSYDDPRIGDLKPKILELSAQYILKEKQPNNNSADIKLPLNAMTRFHGSNGAAVYRLNWPGDLTDSGKWHSAGLLVNYLYDGNKLAERRENFARDGSIEYLNNQ
jgi:malonyl-CoA decarboxylase